MRQKTLCKFRLLVAVIDFEVAQYFCWSREAAESFKLLELKKKVQKELSHRVVRVQFLKDKFKLASGTFLAACSRLFTSSKNYCNESRVSTRK